MVTIVDVAKEAGVAISTVSNVLNNSKKVSDETREKVLNAVEKLHYIPNMNAKLLKTNKKNIVGLFVANMQGDIFNAFLNSIHIRCKLNEYRLNVYSLNEPTPEGLFQLITGSGVSAAIIYGDYISEEYEGIINSLNIPTVVVSKEMSKEYLSSIIMDNKYGSSLAIDYLIDRGFTKIGFMHGKDIEDDKNRYQAFVEGMEKNNLPIEEKWLLDGQFEKRHAVTAMKEFLEKGYELPEAMMCASDEMAWGCIEVLEDAGYKVPEDISVVGYDDIRMSKYYKVPLTTVHMPIAEAGEEAVKEIMRLLTSDNKEGQVIKLEPSFVVRNSCK